jgi:hypothetical protein
MPGASVDDATVEVLRERRIRYVSTRNRSAAWAASGSWEYLHTRSSSRRVLAREDPRATHFPLQPIEQRPDLGAWEETVNGITIEEWV